MRASSTLPAQQGSLFPNSPPNPVAYHKGAQNKYDSLPNINPPRHGAAWRGGSKRLSLQTGGSVSGRHWNLFLLADFLVDLHPKPYLHPGNWGPALLKKLLLQQQPSKVSPKPRTGRAQEECGAPPTPLNQQGICQNVWVIQPEEL